MNPQHPPITNLTAAYRHGQVFLTWAESPTPAGTTFNVYLHDRPITADSLPSARKIGRHIERFSARDWWQDPASFSAAAPPGIPAGFRIANATPPLPPESGLFVHTVDAADDGPRYYAVSAVFPGGIENTTLVSDRNTLAGSVTGRVAPIQPVWLEDGAAPAAGACAGQCLQLNLHGRGDDVRPANCLVFGNASMGWREGLVFKFRLLIKPDTVVVIPYDRAWTGGRPVLESADARDHCPAVNTFWYGYHSRIYETTRTDSAVIPNYTEEYLLWLVRWAQRHLGADTNRTYITGASMGGSGAISMALHHPDTFAAVCADVPIYSYTRPGRGSAVRLECVSGSLARPAFTKNGEPLLEHMNGARVAARTKKDLPYIFATNGRRDESIPWENNPPFYKAMNAARQGLSVYWNNGGHSMSGEAPDDMKDWNRTFLRLRLDESFPAFSRCSDDRNPGDSDPGDGDLEGWINRGLGWKDIVDQPDEYALTVTADYPGLQLPVIVDVTPRRLQRFKLQAGETVKAFIDNQAPVEFQADAGGLLTIPRIRIAFPSGTRLHLSRQPG